MDAEVDFTLEVEYHPIAFHVRRATNVQENVTECVTKALKHFLDGAFPVLEKLSGLWCDLYFPVRNESVYSRYSTEFEYLDKPDLSRRILFTNIFVERIESGDALDGFQPPPFAYLYGDEILPENTKIVVKLRRNKTLTYQLDKTGELYGMDDVLLRILHLTPIASGD